MRSGYQMRKWQASEDRGDQLCPRCTHRIGAHRGIPGVCIENPTCDCVISFGDLEAWRAQGKVMK